MANTSTSFESLKKNLWIKPPIYNSEELRQYMLSEDAFISNLVKLSSKGANSGMQCVSL